VVTYSGYTLNSVAAHPLGRWTFQVRQGARVLASRTVDVVPDDGRELPEGSDANCFLTS
jgi:hypothetical protein